MKNSHVSTVLASDEEHHRKTTRTVFLAAIEEKLKQYVFSKSMKAHK